jgi:hypothetical protein
LIIEYDGRQHAEDTQQWLTDIFRREELDQMRWGLAIVTSEGVYHEPLRTLERVRDALLECGAVGKRVLNPIHTRLGILRACRGVSLLRCPPRCALALDAGREMIRLDSSASWLVTQG